MKEPLVEQYITENARKNNQKIKYSQRFYAHNSLVKQNPKKLDRNSGSGCWKTYRNNGKTGKIVLEPLKYIDFAYVYVDFTVEKFYWNGISRK